MEEVYGIVRNVQFERDRVGELPVSVAKSDYLSFTLDTKTNGARTDEMHVIMHGPIIDRIPQEGSTVKLINPRPINPPLFPIFGRLVPNQGAHRVSEIWIMRDEIQRLSVIKPRSNSIKNATLGILWVLLVIGTYFIGVMDNWIYYNIFDPLLLAPFRERNFTAILTLVITHFVLISVLKRR